jgi:hypothetical protein
MKKLLATMVAAVMLLATAATAWAAGPGDYADFPVGWSRAAMEAAVNNGLLQGDGGKIEPQGKLTRAQMAAVLVRAFGAEKREADLGAYTDAEEGAWYYKELGAAVSIGLFVGDGSGTIRPNDSITREEAALVLSRAFKLAGEAGDIAGHADAGGVSTWAVEGVAALVKAGKMEGYEDGTLRPQGNITREEFAQLMTKLVARYITEAGEYELDVDGTVVIRVPGVTLKAGSRVTGDIILGAEVAREDVAIEEGAEVGGRILVITETIGEEETPGGGYENPDGTATGGGGGSGSPSSPASPGGPAPQPTPAPIPGKYTLTAAFPAFVRSAALNATQHDDISVTVGGTTYTTAMPFWLALKNHMQDSANKATLLATFTDGSVSNTGIFGSITSGADLADITDVINTLNPYLSVIKNGTSNQTLATKLKVHTVTLGDLQSDAPFTLRFEDNKVRLDIIVEQIAVSTNGHQLRTTVSVTMAAGTGSAYNLDGTANAAGSIETFIDQNYAVGADIANIIDTAPFIASVKAALGSAMIDSTTQLNAATVAQIAGLSGGATTVTQTIGGQTVAVTVTATVNQ